MSRITTKYRIRFVHEKGRTELLPIGQYLFEEEKDAREVVQRLNETNNPAWKGSFALVELTL